MQAIYWGKRLWRTKGSCINTQTAVQPWKSLMEPMSKKDLVEESSAGQGWPSSNESTMLSIGGSSGEWGTAMNAWVNPKGEAARSTELTAGLTAHSLFHGCHFTSHQQCMRATVLLDSGHHQRALTLFLKVANVALASVAKWLVRVLFPVLVGMYGRGN